MIRRLLPWFAAAVAASTATIFFLWLIFASRVEEGAGLWAEARRAEGFAISWQRLDIGGFPFYFDLGFVEPRIARGGWSAEAPLLTATLLPWRLEKVDLAAPRLTVTGPAAAAGLEAMTAQLLVEDGRVRSLIVEGAAASARLRGEDLGRADRAALVIELFDPAVTDWQTESVAGKVSLRGTKPASRFAPRLLFEEPYDLDLDGAIKGPVADLVRWRDGGGTVDLRRVVLAWGPLKVDGKGTVALDGEMRPLGAGTAKLQGLPPTLDRLVARGQVKAQDASVAKIVLGLLAQPTADGGSEVTAPVTAQNGRLFLGPVPLLTLQRLGEPAGS